jgi:hypothetical protein
MTKKYYHDTKDITGKLLEEEYIGVCATRQNKQAMLELFKLLSDGKTPLEARNYLPPNKAVRFAKAFQPWDDPTMPETKVAKDLLNFIADELGIEPDSEEEQELKFYTAVGTPLDHKLGVDAFVEYKGKRVEFDVTRNPAKSFEDSTNARIIMEELPDYSDRSQRAAYEQELKKYARRATRILQTPPEPTREFRQQFGAGESLR